MSISLIQSILKKERLDGWLIYDFHGINPIFHKFVRSGHGTRRVFYWIPAEGTPWKIVHKIEANLLQGEGEVHLYATQEELKALISRLKGRIAMEVSPDIPYISFVDAGFAELAP